MKIGLTTFNAKNYVIISNNYGNNCFFTENVHKEPA